MRKLFLIAALSMLACGIPQIFVTPTPAPTASVRFTPTTTSTPTLTPTATFTLAPIPTGTSTLTSTPTLTAYEKYTIAYLRSRAYGGGGIELVEALQREKKFTTYWARYLSDELYIYALVNIPNNAGIYPVFIFIHGYAPPDSYSLLQDDKIIDDELAQQGFITVHPAMRNYPPSDKGDNLFRVGHSIDILNLIAIIKVQSGQPGILEKADPNRIGIAGRSMGGGIALRVLTVSADVKAAVLYSPISGDETRNVPFFDKFALDPQFDGEPTVPASVLARISPSSYYQFITTPILLVHGVKDETVPLAWSEETCGQLKAANVNVTCNFYKNAGHTFSDGNLKKLISQAVEFYRMYLN